MHDQQTTKDKELPPQQILDTSRNPNFSVINLTWSSSPSSLDSPLAAVTSAFEIPPSSQASGPASKTSQIPTAEVTKVPAVSKVPAAPASVPFNLPRQDNTSSDTSKNKISTSKPPSVSTKSLSCSPLDRDEELPSPAYSPLFSYYGLNPGNPIRLDSPADKPPTYTATVAPAHYRYYNNTC